MIADSAEIRFLAPNSWRGRVRTAEVRRLLETFELGRLGPDPGTGPYLAKVRLNRERVKRLAELAGRDVSGFLRGLLAPRLQSQPPGPPTNWPAARAAVATGAAREELPARKLALEPPAPHRAGSISSPEPQTNPY